MGGRGVLLFIFPGFWRQALSYGPATEMLEFPGRNAKLLSKREKACTEQEIGLDWIREWLWPARSTLNHDGAANISVEDWPSFLSLDVPPNPLEERRSCWL